MKHLLFSFALLFIANTSYAGHGMGADFCLTQIGPNQFTLRLQIFRDIGPNSSGADFTAAAEANNTDFRDLVTNQIVNININYTEVYRDTVRWCDPCAEPTLLVEEIVFEATVTIPNNPNGYYVTWDVCCRNTSVDNIAGGAQNFTYAEIPDPAIANGNSTPCFGMYPCDGFICENGSEQCFNLNVTDADMDSLVYSIVQPLNGNTTTQPFIPIPYNPSFSPFATGSSIRIDSATGEVCYKNSTSGIFVVGFKVEEYRNGVKIGEVYRDLQFETTECSASPPQPSMQTISFLQDSTCFDFGTSIGDLNTDTTIMRIESCLFDVGGKLNLGDNVIGCNNCYGYQITDPNGNQISLSTKLQSYDPVTRTSRAVGNNGLRFCLVSPPCEIFDCPTQELTIFFETRQECGEVYFDTVAIPINFTFDSVVQLVAQNHTVTFDEPFCIDYLYRINGLKDTVDMKVEGSAVQYGSLQLPPDNGGNDRTFNYIDANGTTQTDNANIFQTGPNTFRPFGFNSGFRFCGPISNCDVFQTNQLELDVIYSVCDRFADTVHQTINITNTFEPTYVPNVFTPNGDNDNDVFKITGKFQRCFDDFSIKIYDRWGKLVFDAENQEFEWDGTTKSGSESGEGTYYVLLEGTYGLEKVTDQYYITLLR